MRLAYRIYQTTAYSLSTPSIIVIVIVFIIIVFIFFVVILSFILIISFQPIIILEKCQWLDFGVETQFLEPSDQFLNSIWRSAQSASVTG